jgi:prepilin-type N-terminal cleavage/methylation domain-containing protein
VATVKADRGTSLVELLVVLALLSLMMLAAAQLVIHSIQLLGATGRSVRNPILVHVTNRLRNDVQEAAGVTTVEDVWTEDPLELRTRTGGLVRIGVEKGNLVRRAVAPGSGEVEERVLLRGVVSWWWRSPIPGVIDLNIGYLVNPESEHHRARKVGYARERRNENLRFAIRGGGEGSRW